MPKMLFAGLLAGVVLAACHSSKPETSTPPEPSAAEIAWQKQIQDSLDALAKAQADSVARAQELALQEKQRADSIEAARVAEEARVRDSTERVAAEREALKTELTQMVHFATGSAKLSEEGQSALDRKVEILTANPEVQLKITGACDERGSEAFNMALGNRRALAVSKYLVSKGIAADRLTHESAGEGSPVDPGHDEEAWQQNRRAEFASSGDESLAMNP